MSENALILQIYTFFEYVKNRCQLTEVQNKEEHK